jgi:3-phenylpropionate/trans-cinnamate dioxygenase ferredoxin reductase subunit
VSVLERVVVVGGGLAGLQSLIALRAQGYGGRLTLVGAEPHLPYDRPPLSKAVLLGERNGPEIDVTFDADWDAVDVELLLGRRATGLREGVVETDIGPVPFDGLVIATGATPVTLPGTDGLDTVHVLRTVEHAYALRAAFTPGTRVLIVGAGWIGAEVATAAARAGCKVTVVEGRGTPLAAALPAEVGARTAPWYAAAGVELRLGAPVRAVEPGALHLAGGERLSGDHIVVGIGVRPATDWLAGSGVLLDARGAVSADSGLRTTLPGVFAAGDCASWESGRFGVRLLVEHWDNALHAPATAAENLLGGAASYDPVPYFWSEQFGRMVQYAGHHPVADELVWRGAEPGDGSSDGWAACWLREGRLVALLTVDRPRDLVQGRRVVAQARPVDRDRLADPAVPIKNA